MADRVSVKIPAKAAYLSLARLCASGICANADVDMDTLADIRLILTESCNLSFRIGRSEEITIVLLPQEDGLEFRVSGIAERDLEDDEMLRISSMIIESLADSVSFGEDEIVVVKKFGD